MNIENIAHFRPRSASIRIRRKITPTSYKNTERWNLIQLEQSS